jgi:hypothetical protein
VAAKRVEVPAVRFGSARLECEPITRLFTTGVRIATFRYAAPAPCGAFADERRVVAATKGRGRTRNAHPVPSGSTALGLTSGFWVRVSAYTLHPVD